MKIIPVKHFNEAHETLISDKRYKMVSKLKLRLQKDKGKNTFYVATDMKIKGKWKTMKLHRLIMGCKPGDGQIVDHIDGNGLNNQDENLRFVTKSENNMNVKRLRKDNTSGYKGVTKRGDKWCAQINKDGKQIHIGCFKTKRDAALAYNRVAKELYGDIAFENPIRYRV